MLQALVAGHIRAAHTIYAASHSSAAEVPNPPMLVLQQQMSHAKPQPYAGVSLQPTIMSCAPILR
jgi:hypothetical protein